MIVTVVLDLIAGVGVPVFAAVSNIAKVFGKIGFEKYVATKCEMMWGRGCFVYKARGWLRRACRSLSCPPCGAGGARFACKARRWGARALLRGLVPPAVVCKPLVVCVLAPLAFRPERSRSPLRDEGFRSA